MSRHGRGQLLLSTAFVLAVLLVVLALALNTAIFTGNLATQGSNDVEAHHVRQLQADTRGATGSLLGRVNRQTGTSYSTLVDDLDTDLDRWEGLTGRHEAVGGGDVTLSLNGTTNGTRIRQTNASRSLTNESGDGNWTLVTGSPRTRGFALSLSNTSLVETDENSSVSELESDGVFRVEVTNATGDQWRVFVYRDDDDDEVLVRVENATGSLHPPCQTPTNDTVRIDISGATVGGDACAPLSFLAAMDTQHDVQYRHGTNASGTYSLTVDRLRSSVEDADYGPEGASDAPFVTEVIYGARVDFTYASSSVRYRTTVPVVPGDTDG